MPKETNLTTIPISSEEYQRLLGRRERKIEELKEIRSQYVSFQGSSDSFHGDNLRLLEEMQTIQNQICGIDQILLEIQVIEESNQMASEINIGDTVLLNMNYGNEDVEEDVYTLVSGECNSLNNEIEFRSPIGQGIHKRKVGEQILVTLPMGNVQIHILKKVPKKEQELPVKRTLEIPKKKEA